MLRHEYNITFYEKKGNLRESRPDGHPDDRQKEVPGTLCA